MSKIDDLIYEAEQTKLFCKQGFIELTERELTLLRIIKKMSKALDDIKAYDKDSKYGKGACPYGCDTPSIADNALTSTQTQLEKL